MRLTSRLRGGVGVAWRYGLANVSRRGTGSVVQIVAFGLGLMVLLLLAVVRGDLLADWRRSLPNDVPNNFLVNIRPEQRQALQEFLQAHGFGSAADVSHGACAHHCHQFANRRSRSSCAATSARRICGAGTKPHLVRGPDGGQPAVAGRWWTAADAGKPLVSISSEYAEACT